MAPIVDQSYRERAPAPALAGVLSAVWIQRVAPDAPPYIHRTVPNGSVELACRVGAGAVLVGPRTGPDVSVLAPGSVVVGARLRPGVGPFLVGAPPAELSDRVVAAGELWGPAAAALGERVAAAETPELAAAVLEQQVARRLAAGGGPDPLVAEAVRRLMPWQDDDVGSLPEQLWISERQLRRRVHEAAGLGPKTLHRILRFQGLLALAQLALHRGHAPIAGGLGRLAAEAGYADQSHLARECRRLTGLSPRRFLSEIEEKCGHGHDHTASFAPLLRSRAPRMAVSF
ncbi:MAG TPA: helix-turn-helix domain-containing protein [Solirubrobacteraceae bacterium]|nr:helix-turn-helix domain-containing protein [Solirubrobacteraceae bacterium]